jgi:hypothetical protein
MWPAPGRSLNRATGPPALALVRGAEQPVGDSNREYAVKGRTSPVRFSAFPSALRAV